MLSFYISFLVNQKPFISLQTDKKLAELCNGLVREAILYYIVGGGGGGGDGGKCKNMQIIFQKVARTLHNHGDYSTFVLH